MDKKLSIVQRTVDKIGWDKSNNFSSTDISNIKVYNIRNDRSLNAIPSPLSRMHLFESAFELLDKDESNNTTNSGDTFQKIVSDCLDVFELIYNWNNHLRDGKKLSIIKWNIENEIGILKGSNQKHKLLGETLEVFLKDESFENCEDIFIIKLDNKVIAGSSPFTGFFTTPNDLSNINLNNPLTRRNYFSKIVPFKDRKKEIKKYVIKFINNPSIAKTTQTIRNYFQKYSKDIDANDNLHLEDVNEINNQMFGKTLQSSSMRTESDYFENYLVKLNYRINDECFHLPLCNNPDRKHDYLLPLTKSFFEDYTIEDVSSKVKIEERGDSTVEVSFIDGEIEFKKKYQATKIAEQDGEIIDLNENYSIKINLGIFPFIKVSNVDTHYNDFYKILLTVQDNNYNYKNEDFRLSFRIDKNFIIPPTNNNYFTSIEHRTILERDKATTGSTYYTLKGKENRSVCFDLIEIEFPFKKNNNIKSTIAPKWRTVNLGEKQIDYAIDFGTTSTFISYTDDKAHEHIPKPFSINIESAEKHLQVEFLNKPKNKSEDLSWISCYEESLQDFVESIEIQKQEFIPSLINTEKYSLPFRSVVYQKKGVQDNKKNLFGNTNIGFLYQKQTNFATHLNQEYESNLKWNIKKDSNYEKCISIFIEEIFFMMKTNTILKGGDPKKSCVTWFSPLSFTAAAEREYLKIWNEIFKEVFKSSETQNLRKITESEAPFYFYTKSAVIDNESSVLTIDIGGGTTDVMYIENKIPKICTSFHFGANILWGNGFNEFKINAKENGIYNKLKDEINNRLKSTELKSLNEEYNLKDSNFSSDEILNFWIYNNYDSDVLKNLDKGIFRLSYLLHFTSIIYHILKLLKYNNPDISTPTCIIFSGNGSKYIDLIQSEDYIKKICGYFIRNVYGDNNKDPQIILPKENRKEATCYGGLFLPFDQEKKYQSVNYLGFESANEKIEKYSELEEKKNVYFNSLINSFENFIEMFFKMNNIPELSFRNHFGIESDLQLVKKYIIDKSRENLELGYSKRKININSDDPITDSIFFYPLIGLLFNINKISEADIRNLINSKKTYALSYDVINGFSLDRITENRKPDSIFLIEFENDNSEIANLKIIEDNSVIKRSLQSIEGYLKPVCEWNEFPTKNTQSLKIIKPGTLEKRENSWFIKEKIQIEFI